jgi:cell division protein ZapA (FtsZ GTPase activity inhibitor)
MGGDTKIPIEIGGQSFRIRPPGGNEDRLRRAAAYVGEKIAGIEQAGAISTQRSALLAALEITLELLAVHENPTNLSEEELLRARDQIDAVIAKIDSALTQSPE